MAKSVTLNIGSVTQIEGSAKSVLLVISMHFTLPNFSKFAKCTTKKPRALKNEPFCNNMICGDSSNDDANEERQSYGHGNDIEIGKNHEATKELSEKKEIAQKGKLLAEKEKAAAEKDKRLAEKEKQLIEKEKNHFEIFN